MDKKIIERFKKISTASIADACDQIVGRRCYMDFEIKPRINDQRIVGPAITISEGPAKGKFPPQHALEAIDGANEGDIIVISLKGQIRDVAVFGGIMTAGSVVNKLAGAILDNGLRDVTEIKRDFNFPIFSRSISPGTTVGRYKTLAKNVPITCGGIKVNPQDLIVADLDGVVVIPKKSIQKVLEASEKIEATEMQMTKFIKETKSIIKGIKKFNRI
jgi:4-hydroxy-4-methyl-2-oxoglutarate aldolase